MDQIDIASALEEIKQVAGLMEVLVRLIRVCTTDTVDFDVIVSGEVYLELDDGLRFGSRRVTA